MKTRVKLKPGQHGTKKHVEKYGDSLVCVRYRCDAEKRKRYKTIELAVSEWDWTPPPAKYPDSTLVALKIGASEIALRSQVKAVGGHWDPNRKLWIVPYGCIKNTRLEKLIDIETPKATYTTEMFLHIETRAPAVATRVYRSRNPDGL